VLEGPADTSPNPCATLLAISSIYVPLCPLAARECKQKHTAQSYHENGRDVLSSDRTCRSSDHRRVSHHSVPLPRFQRSSYDYRCGAR